MSIAGRCPRVKCAGREYEIKLCKTGGGRNHFFRRVDGKRNRDDYDQLISAASLADGSFPGREGKLRRQCIFFRRGCAAGLQSAGGQRRGVERSFVVDHNDVAEGGCQFCAAARRPESIASLVAGLCAGFCHLSRLRFRELQRATFFRRAQGPDGFLFHQRRRQLYVCGRQ